MDWEPYVLIQPIDFAPSAVVLDVGCGWGTELAQCNGRFKVGIEPDHKAAVKCHKFNHGFPTLRAEAENLPFVDNSFDGIICKGVLPFTIEDQALREITRLLRPDGKCYLISLGSGYYLRYFLLSRSIKYKVYGLRALLNTWWWVLFHRNLPGFIGDTIYQSIPRLHRYFKENGLILDKERSTSFIGLPVFIYSDLHTAPVQDTINAETNARRRGLAPAGQP